MQIRIRISKWIMNPIIGLFIAMGTNNNLFTYAAVLFSLVCIVFYSSHDSLGVLLFIMSFTHIFKSAPGTTSFFIILMLFYIMWNLLKRTRRFDAVVGEIIIFIAYIAVVHFASGLMRISELIKFASGFLFLYLALSMVDYNKIRDLLLSYIFGVLISSFLKVSEAFPNAVFYTNEAIELVRFTGMHGDPNYYGVNLIISMCLVVIMYHRREIPTLMAVLIVGLLVWLSTLTVSKAVFLMLGWTSFPAVLLLGNGSAWSLAKITKNSCMFPQVLHMASLLCLTMPNLPINARIIMTRQAKAVLYGTIVISQ